MVICLYLLPVWGLACLASLATWSLSIWWVICFVVYALAGGNARLFWELFLGVPVLTGFGVYLFS